MATASHDLGRLARYLSIEVAARNGEAESESVAKRKGRQWWTVTVQRRTNIVILGLVLPRREDGHMG